MSDHDARARIDHVTEQLSVVARLMNPVEFVSVITSLLVYTYLNSARAETEENMDHFFATVTAECKKGVRAARLQRAVLQEKRK